MGNPVEEGMLQPNSNCKRSPNTKPSYITLNLALTQ